jgi:hypothetical protein
MSRFIFAVAVALVLTSPAAAQRVPGRDLLEFPLGLLAEAAPLSTLMTGGLWNPATAALSGPRRAAFGFAGLTTPQEQGVQLNLLGAAYNVRPKLTATLSVASASVSDILRTDTDPVSLGAEIPYGTTLLSAGLATARDNLSLGVATRYRWGSSDTERVGAFSLDAGAIVDHVARTPLRVAFSTFLFTPGGKADEATYMIAGDVPVLRRDSTATLRAGYSVSHTAGRGRDEYVFATSQYRQLDLSAGLSRTFVFGNVNNRWRLGAGLHHAGYTVAMAREDGAAGLGASYQFLFMRVVK